MASSVLSLDQAPIVSPAALLEKYDVPTPRYTSYPTVPHWVLQPMPVAHWSRPLSIALATERRVSLYIHLPYCEKLCTYCGCNKRITANHAVEQPYLDTLWKEWQLYREYFGQAPVVEEIHLGGGTPTFFAPHRLGTWLHKLLADVTLAPDAVLSVEVHPNVTSLEHLQVLADLGFNRLSVGIQDFDPTVQAVINRYQTFEKTAQIFSWARMLGFSSINADLVYGLPKQNLSTVKSTFELVQHLKPERISFYSYAHVPWKAKGQRGYSEADLPTGAEKRALYELGASMLKQQGYHEIGMDHFALPEDDLFLAREEGRLHRNFMGYTASPTDVLIGLGASSISDIGYAYAQNLVTIEEWQAKVLSGHFPLAKGHVLNDEDLFIKNHILNLMCQLKTTWGPLEPEQKKIVKRATNTLATMEHEGLVLLSENAIEVTEAGRPFLRHICQAWDAYGGGAFSRGI